MPPGDDSSFQLHTPSGRDIEVLDISREEAQRSLDNRLDLLYDIDDKAMRTVRITLLTLGIFLSAATFPGAARFINVLTAGGAGLLVLAILFGLITYSASDPDLGMGMSYLTDAREEAYTEEEWLEVVLAGYEEWCADLETLNSGEQRWLSVTQLCLGAGVVALALGVFFAFTGHIDPIIPINSGG